MPTRGLYLARLSERHQEPGVRPPRLNPISLCRWLPLLQTLIVCRRCDQVVRTDQAVARFEPLLNTVASVPSCGNMSLGT